MLEPRLPGLARTASPRVIRKAQPHVQCVMDCARCHKALLAPDVYTRSRVHFRCHLSMAKASVITDGFEMLKGKPIDRSIVGYGY